MIIPPSDIIIPPGWSSSENVKLSLSISDISTLYEYSSSSIPDMGGTEVICGASFTASTVTDILTEFSSVPSLAVSVKFSVPEKSSSGVNVILVLSRTAIIFIPSEIEKLIPFPSTSLA